MAEEDVTEKVRQCKEGGVCACKEARENLFKTTAACLPYKVSQFKGEWSYFKEQISSPLDITVGDLKQWPAILIIGFFLFYLGLSFGRGHLHGFQYDVYDKDELKY